MGRTPPVIGRTDAILAQQNLNYANNPATPQAAAFRNLIASQAAAGNSITNITISLGFNELGALANLPASQALAALPATLATYQANYATVLSKIRSLEPNAALYLIGYYNPFVADPTANPAKPIFAQGGTERNAIIHNLATQFDANFVNTNTAFLGREGQLTDINQYPSGSTSPGQGAAIEPIGNVHPNDAGYTTIANQVAAVPEPASLGLVGVAATVLLLLRRHR